MVSPVETERLILREVDSGDAAFVRELLNEPAWLEFVGDRGIYSDDDARAYIRDRLRPSYAKHGFGFLAVQLAADATPMGLCGIVKRDTLDDVDLGFAFLERHWHRGYARESAEAIIRFAKEVAGLERLVAITDQNNVASMALLVKLGMEFEKLVELEGEDEPLRLYGMAL